MKLEEQLIAIEARNARVDADKAWEVSLTRRGVISVITYFTAAFFMMLNDFTNPWLGAFVPVLGYILSTLSLPWVKRYWLSRRKPL